MGCSFLNIESWWKMFRARSRDLFCAGGGPHVPQTRRPPIYTVFKMPLPAHSISAVTTQAISGKGNCPRVQDAPVIENKIKKFFFFCSAGAHDRIYVNLFLSLLRLTSVRTKDWTTIDHFYSAVDYNRSESGIELMAGLQSCWSESREPRLAGSTCYGGGVRLDAETVSSRQS